VRRRKRGMRARRMRARRMRARRMRTRNVSGLWRKKSILTDFQMKKVFQWFRNQVLNCRQRHD